MIFSDSVYSGHQSILIPPMELESNLFLWLATVSQYKIRDTFCSYSVMDMCTKGLGNQVDVLRVRSSSLFYMHGTGKKILKIKRFYLGCQNIVQDLFFC